jgi:hypothetical protein
MLWIVALLCLAQLGDSRFVTSERFEDVVSADRELQADYTLKTSTIGVKPSGFNPDGLNGVEVFGGPRTPGWSVGLGKGIIRLGRVRAF